MSATHAVNINNGIKNGAANGKANGSANGNGALNESPTATGGTPLLKRGFSAINANVHEMYV